MLQIGGKGDGPCENLTFFRFLFTLWKKQEYAIWWLAP
jgi:hypothetical protein